MTKKTLPARGIMTTGVYDGARAFRVACDCQDNAHDVDVWIEVETEKDVNEVTVTFYRELDTPFWEPGFNRLREAWRILVHGRSRFSGSLIIGAETAETLCDAIRSTVEELKHK